MQSISLLRQVAREQGLNAEALPRHPAGTQGGRPGPAGLTSRCGNATILPMRTTPPFSADHVGSLLRPASLLAARDDFAAGKIDAAQLRAAEDTAIADVVAMQRDVGLRSVTDGEFRRATWHMDFI